MFRRLADLLSSDSSMTRALLFFVPPMFVAQPSLAAEAAKPIHAYTNDTTPKIKTN